MNFNAVKNLAVCAKGATTDYVSVNKNDVLSVCDSIVALTASYDALRVAVDNSEYRDYIMNNINISDAIENVTKLMKDVLGV